MAKPTVIKRQTQHKRELSPEEAKEKAKKLQDKKARIAQILSTGLTAQMLRVKHKDPSKRYAYVRDREVDIEKYQALGYEIDTEQPQGDGHETGDNRKKVGDVILMSIGRDEFEVIEEVKREMVERRHETNPAKREYMRQATDAAAKGSAAPPVDLAKEG